MPLPDLPPTPAAAERRSRPRGAKVLAILGLVLLVSGVLAGRSGTDRVQGAVEDIQANGDEVRNSLLIEVPVPGEDDVVLPPGRYDVFALAPDGTFNRRTPTTAPGTILSDDPTDPTTPVEDPDDPLPDVEITGPDGRTVLTRQPGIEAIFTAASGQLYPIASFTVTERGTFHVRASGTQVTKVGVGPTVDTGNVGRLVGGGLFAILGFLLGGVGFILLVIGVIWFFVAGDPAKKPVPTGPWAAGPAPWGPGPAGPWAGPPGPWGPGPGAAPGPPGWAPPGGAWGTPPGAWGAPQAPPPTWGAAPAGPTGQPLPPPPAAPAADEPEPAPEPSALFPPRTAEPPPWGAAPPTRPTSWPDDPTRPGT